MPKQVIILEVNSLKPKIISLRYLLWLTTASPIPKPVFSSQWTGVSAPETSALQAGTTVEETFVQDFPDTLTTAQIKTFLNAHYTSRQSYYASTTQPGAFYGVFFDGSAWSA